MPEESELEKARWAAQVLANHRFKNESVWNVQVTTSEVHSFGKQSQKQERTIIMILADQRYSLRYDVEEAVAIAKGLEATNEND